MADSAQDNKVETSGDSATNKISLTIKTAKEKENIEIDENAMVEELRKKVAEKFKTDDECVCLIFAGKILKDTESLMSHKIRNGLTVHLVIKGKKAADGSGSSAPTSGSTPSAPSSTTNPSPPTSNPSPPTAGVGGLGGLGGMGMGLDGLANPEMMRQMMDNPMVRDMMSNPEFLRGVIGSSPQMQQLMERNPEISHVLNNPEVLRQTMDFMRNPAALQEMMRSQDRALSNLESIPGGYNALQRMYSELQEPLMNASQDFRANPFASRTGGNDGADSTTNPPAQTESRDPLPNPWAAPSPGTGNAARPGPGAGAAPGAGGLPGMADMMSTMRNNPQMMSQLMGNPMMQQMMNQVTSNPEMMRNMLEQNPIFNANPQMREHMQSMLPRMMEQMQDPNVMNILANPEAIEAMNNIRRGYEQLARVAPGFVPPDIMNQMGLGGGAAPGAGGADAPVELATMMNRILGSGGIGGGQGGAPLPPPEERFRDQLEQLSTMGFTNREVNIRALTATFGDVNAAIDHILNSM